MDIRGNKLVGYIFIKDGILEDITSCIIYYMDIGIIYSSCECVKEFLVPFVYACA